MGGDHGADGGWLWPVEYEPRVGGAERGLSPAGGTVTVWEPDARFATRAEKPGWFNVLEYELEPRDGGTHLRYRHTSVFETTSSTGRAWRTRRSTSTRSASTCATSPVGTARSRRSRVPRTPRGPARSPPRAGRSAPATREAGDRIEAELPGCGRVEATVDYRTDAFLGLRTEDALYRVFGREAWGWPVGATLHLFGDDADGAAAKRAWDDRLGGLSAVAA